MEKIQLEKELKKYQWRCELINLLAIDYDGAKTVNGLKELINEIKDIANGKSDDEIEEIINK